MDEKQDLKAAVTIGLRRAALHWLRAGYEVVAGVGALLNEVAESRHSEAAVEETGDTDDGPVRIELD
jgi:hypothetical protein